MEELLSILFRGRILMTFYKYDELLKIFGFCLFFLSVGNNFLQAGDMKILKFGKLIDSSGKALTNAVIVVNKDRIVNVFTDECPSIPEAETIDLSAYTAISGLIDVHTHMTYYWDQTPGTNPWSQSSSRSPALNVSLSRENAMKTLEIGVTTVRDLGAFDPEACERMDIAMRDLINSGSMPGPRMFVCGYALIAASPSPAGFDSLKWGQVGGIADIKRVVKREIAAGADWIKMFASTGSADDVSGFPTFTREEIRTAVEMTHDLDRPIAVHSYGPEAAHDAIISGANSIEHATDLNEETIQEMVRRGTFYVPTIDHNRYYIDHADEFGYVPEVKRNLEAFIKRNLETARHAYQAGVRFAMGSDALFTMFGQNTRELSWFIKVGMTPKEALDTATINGAALLGMENDLGKIAPGFLADIVAVKGNPLSDINVVINNVKWVMKDGRVVLDKRNF
jgi:imidazolonepropionase-like amidohydrolase